MKLTQAVRYAVGAAVHLARQPGDLISSQRIAAAEGLPERFLLKVLKPLVSAGILYSIRGPHGGYRLARPAKDVTLLMLLEAVDGPIRGEAGSVMIKDGDRIQRQLQSVCEQAADVYRRSLQRVRLTDLAKR